jgi:hypothetical protein
MGFSGRYKVALVEKESWILLGQQYVGFKKIILQTNEGLFNLLLPKNY